MIVNAITQRKFHFTLNLKIIFIIIGALMILGTAGYFTWNYFHQQKVAYDTKMQVITNAFYQTYGQDITALETVNPKEYFVTVWKDAQGYTNVSANLGGVWVLLKSTPPENTEEIPENNSP